MSASEKMFFALNKEKGNKQFVYFKKIKEKKKTQDLWVKKTLRLFF